MHHASYTNLIIASLQLSSNVDMNSLDLRVRVQAGLTQLAADTTLLDTAKRDAEVAIIAAVHPDHTGLDIARDTVRALQVLSEERRAETERRVVGTVDSLSFLDEARDDDERAKDLLAVDAHVVLDVGEDGRLNEEALAADVLVRHAAGGQRRALGLARLDVR